MTRTGAGEAPLTLLAPAKLTLSLRITGVRDDGYHLIDAEMVSVDLYDRIELDPDGDVFTVVRDGAAEPGSPDDLVQQALRAARRRAGIELHKHIPAGAGLGGGSSDAAAVLRWAGVDDLELAARIGADVAFCLRGGRARVQGIGEIVEPLPFEASTFTLLTPPVHASTPVVYRCWDDMGGPRNEVGDNDLELAALEAYPQLGEWRDELERVSGRRPRLAGSGSTWFVEGAHPGPGRKVVSTLPSGR